MGWDCGLWGENTGWMNNRKYRWMDIRKYRVDGYKKIQGGWI